MERKDRMKLLGRIFFTGDTHGDFDRIAAFCKKYKTTKKDVLIILGDAGVNFMGLNCKNQDQDRFKKQFLADLPITILCIHGNHEMRPYKVLTCMEKMWQGGIVYVDETYPDLLYAKDGEIYDLNGKSAIAIGGAYSVDKYYRIIHGWPWWDDEQPSGEVKQYVEKQLEKLHWTVDIVMSHTVPLKYEPREVFLDGINQEAVDKSTEIWLDEIEAKLKYEAWLAGHYHTEKKVDKLELMFENYREWKL